MTNIEGFLDLFIEWFNERDIKCKKCGATMIWFYIGSGNCCVEYRLHCKPNVIEVYCYKKRCIGVYYPKMEILDPTFDPNIEFPKLVKKMTSDLCRDTHTELNDTIEKIRGFAKSLKQCDLKIKEVIESPIQLHIVNFRK